MSDYDLARSIFELVLLSEERGLPANKWKVPLKNRKKGDNFISFLTQDCPNLGEDSLSRIKQNECRRLLVDDYISVDEAAGVFEFEYSVTQKNFLNQNLPSLSKIAQLIHRGGCILIPPPPRDMSFREIANLPMIPVSSYSGGRRCDFSEDAIVREGVWLAILMKEHELSTGKIFNAQKNLLVREEYVPNAAEMLYALSVYYLVRKKLSFERTMVRTSSEGLPGSHVAIGRFYKTTADEESRVTISVNTLDRAQNSDCGLAVGICLQDSSKDRELLT